MFSTIEPLDFLNSPPSIFPWPRLRDLFAKHTVGARDFLCSMWSPIACKCYLWDPKKKKFNLTKLNPYWVDTFLPRVEELVALGRSVVLTLIEFCGIRWKDTWPWHPYNPARNIQKWGSADKFALMSDPQYLMEPKRLFEMVWDALTPKSRSKVIWELGNEPGRREVVAQVELAKWLHDTMKIPSQRIQCVVSRETEESFSHNRDWRRCVGQKAFHRVRTAKDIDAAFGPGGWLCGWQGTVPNTDGGVDFWKLQPAALRAMLDRSPAIQVMWNLPHDPPLTPAEWNPIFTRTAALMQILSEEAA